MTKIAAIRAGQAEDIAVVGLACLFPGAPNVGTYWRNILAKFDAITDPPPEAWDPALYYDVDTDENDRVYCKKGGYLERIEIRNRPEITALFTVHAIVFVGVDVVVQSRIPGFRRWISDGVELGQDIAPESADAGRTRKQTRHADNRDVFLAGLD